MSNETRPSAPVEPLVGRLRSENAATRQYNKGNQSGEPALLRGKTK